MSTKEKIAEGFALPDDVLALRETAMFAEVAHHIFDVFGYDVTSMDGESQEYLLYSFIDQDVLSDGDLVRPIACRAFVQFARDNNCMAECGISEMQASEWMPRN